MLNTKTGGTLTDLMKLFGIWARYAEKADFQPRKEIMYN